MRYLCQGVSKNQKMGFCLRNQLRDSHHQEPLMSVRFYTSNLQGEHRPPPREFQLFSFILRRHFNLKWKVNIFKAEFWHPRYVSKLATGDIFQVLYPEPFLKDSL